MNNDLVKRIAVCDMLHDEMGAWGNCADEIEALLKANDALWKIPAVDAVEVCRCKDCKWGVKDSCDISYQCTIDAEYDEDLGGYVGFVEWHKSDHFCSYGERRTDERD